MKDVLQLYLSFVRIGALLIGGGYAMLPLLEDEIVRRHRWAAEEEVADFFALAQALPGVIAINTAMLVGQKIGGFPGLLAAALGTVTVPFLLIALYASTYAQINDLPLVTQALAGMRPAVAGMILAMGVRMLLKCRRRA